MAMSLHLYISCFMWPAYSFISPFLFPIYLSFAVGMYNFKKPTLVTSQSGKGKCFSTSFLLLICFKSQYVLMF